MPRVLFGLWRFYIAQPQLHSAREIGDTLLRLAQPAHVPSLSVIAHYALGTTWFWLGAFPAALQHLEEGIARYTPDQRHAMVFRIGQDPLGSSRGGEMMLARRLTMILPDVSLVEAIETTRIHSVADLAGDRTALVIRRPFCAPPHPSSDVGLIGGGPVPLPGEVSRAHSTGLSLDELSEWVDLIHYPHALPVAADLGLPHA